MQRNLLLSLESGNLLAARSRISEAAYMCVHAQHTACVLAEADICHQLEKTCYQAALTDRPVSNWYIGGPDSKKLDSWSLRRMVLCGQK